MRLGMVAEARAASRRSRIRAGSRRPRRGRRFPDEGGSLGTVGSRLQGLSRSRIPARGSWICGNQRAAAARRFAKRSAISRPVRTASAPFSVRLSAWSARSSVEHSECDGNPRFDGCELQPARCLARHVVEVRRVAADHAAERDDAGETARLREGHGRQRQFERSGHGHHGDGVARDAERIELGQCGFEQSCRDVAVESRHDDADGAALADRGTLEDRIARRQGQLARGVLHRGRDMVRERRWSVGQILGRLGEIRVIGVGDGHSRGRLAFEALDRALGPPVEDVLARGVEVGLTHGRRRASSSPATLGSLDLLELVVPTGGFVPVAHRLCLAFARSSRGRTAPAGDALAVRSCAPSCRVWNRDTPGSRGWARSRSAPGRRRRARSRRYR